jgi:hypothetical protein
MVDRKQKRRNGLGTRYNLQRHGPSDLLLPVRPCLLKFLPPPKIVPPDGDQLVGSTHKPVGKSLFSKHDRHKVLSHDVDSESAGGIVILWTDVF